MMAYSEDHIALAAEYALGTLDADERAQVETMMAVDQDFTAMVEAWGNRLGALNQMVGSVEPRPEVWEKIRTAAGLSEPQAPLVLPDAPPPPVAPEVIEALADNSNVIRFSNEARRWRRVAAVTTTIAAALVAMIALGVYQPDLLPDQLHPKPRARPNMLPSCRRTAGRRRSFSPLTEQPGISRFERSTPPPSLTKASNFG